MIDGLHARAALKSALFGKLLRVPAVGGGHADARITAAVDGHVSSAGRALGGAAGAAAGGSGKLLNLQNGDARAIEACYHMCVYVLFVPLQLALYMYVLYSEIRLATLVARRDARRVQPGRAAVGAHEARAQAALAAAADARMRGVKETVTAALAVKAFCWEDAFAARVAAARARELRHGARLARLGALSASVMEVVPVVCALCSLAAWGLLYDAPLTASRAFMSLLVFNQLRMPLLILPMARRDARRRPRRGRAHRRVPRVRRGLGLRAPRAGGGGRGRRRGAPRRAAARP